MSVFGQVTCYSTTVIPEGILRLYCNAVGIDFQHSMLKWKHLDEDLEALYQKWGEWLKVACESTGLTKPVPSELPEVKDLPPHVQKIIEDAVPLYCILHRRRLRVHM